MSTRLSLDTAVAMQKVLDQATSGASPSIPGLVYCSINRDDTVFWMASCTKLITSIACMQMVEQGKLDLDSVQQLESLAPELKTVQVLEQDSDGGFRLVPKERGITLRMLLNHTSGFGYAFEDLKLNDWSRPVGLDDFSGNEADVLYRPLVNQPGTKFQYGVGMDWAGVLVERITGIPLEEYPLLARKPADERKGFCMGGAGCFGKPAEFCRVQLLKPETVAEGWGLSFSLSHQKSGTGRAAGSGSWEGLANLFWFADRDNGVGAIIASQILPYGDLKLLDTMEAVEVMMYAELLRDS
ncbi:hypothetical protein N8T08_006118 [Aspergillus melleus]|uniref:Uncharacterized protein n=1 Tax=Aspergillus melleus TaxID=138277 RepID=A0ACC3B0H2_9EURO|nr:hypothetical protein N8T08_006118 [Aspergillus melleus]